MYMRSKICLIFMLLIPVFFIKGNKVNAEDLGFSAQVIPPKTQIDKKTPYLDLQMSPSEKTRITVKVKNTSLEYPLKIHVNYSSAKTNSEGIVEYVPYDTPIDQSLRFNFENIVEGPSDFELAPNEQKDLFFEIKMPREQFDGYIAGGIELVQVVNNDSPDGVETEFSYIIGAKISQNNNKVTEEIKYRNIQTGTQNNEPAIITSLANTSNDYIEGMEIDVSIKKRGTNKNLLTKSKKNMRMAPNSMILFPVKIDNKAVTTGKYTATIQVKTKEGFQDKWTKAFFLNLKNDGKYQISTPKEKMRNHYGKKIFLVVVVIVTLGVGCSVMIFRKIRR